jgi:hypothetical protein
MRRADWIEAALLVAAFTMAVVLLPVALVVGSNTYARAAKVGAEQVGTRHAAAATLLQDAPPKPVGLSGEVVSSKPVVLARWTLSDGTERTGAVRAGTGAKRGDRVPIWLDQAGNPVGRPITYRRAAMAGATVAVGGWLVAVAFLCGFFLLARVGLDRSRSAAWQRDWARVEPAWTRST